ncbi:hypothetical protein FOZ61_007862 [Perkinsus olseni]|uniref:Uncharacterized protein n=1 Tax=Perkinsus olseni TaxID=32597 RepID=A0A7J6L6Z8_PEROL|nr:hypothetical protein FOZ61_007862 [Perkinsus olseni]
MAASSSSFAASPREPGGYSRRRHRSLDPMDSVDRNRLMTDRSAYVSYLEVQLERVTASCLTVQGFSDRINQVADQCNEMEARVNGLGRQLRELQALQLEEGPQGQQQAGGGGGYWQRSLERRLAKLEAEVRDGTPQGSARGAVASSPRSEASGPSSSLLEDLTDQIRSFEAEVMTRLDAVEDMSQRLAEEAMNQVEEVKHSVDEVRGSVTTLEARSTQKMNEGLQRVGRVLKRVVQAQRAMQQRMASAVKERGRGPSEEKERTLETDLTEASDLAEAEEDAGGLAETLPAGPWLPREEETRPESKGHARARSVGAAGGWATADRPSMTHVINVRGEVTVTKSPGPGDGTTATAAATTAAAMASAVSEDEEPSEIHTTPRVAHAPPRGPRAYSAPPRNKRTPQTDRTATAGGLLNTRAAREKRQAEIASLAKELQLLEREEREFHRQSRLRAQKLQKGPLGPATRAGGGAGRGSKVHNVAAASGLSSTSQARHFARDRISDYGLLGLLLGLVRLLAWRLRGNMFEVIQLVRGSCTGSVCSAAGVSSKLSNPTDELEWVKQWRTLLSHLSREVDLHRSREAQQHVAGLRALLDLPAGTPVERVIAAARRVPNPSNHCRLCVKGVERKLARGVDMRALEGLRQRHAQLIQELELIEAGEEYKRYLRIRKLLQGSLDAGSPRRSSGEMFEQYVCYDDYWLKRAVAYRLRVQDWSRWELSRNAVWLDQKGRRCGEVDCGVVVGESLVAVIECKAGCLQIATAASQQERHLSESPGCTLLLRDGTRAVPSSDCMVFVATTLPDHRYGLWVKARENNLSAEEIIEVVEDARRRIPRWCRQEKLRSGDKLLGMLAATLWLCGDFPVSPRGCSSASPGVSECDWESGDRLASDRAGLNMILRRELEVALSRAYILVMAFSGAPFRGEVSSFRAVKVGILDPVSIIVLTANFGTFGDIEKVEISDSSDPALIRSCEVTIRYFDSRCAVHVVKNLGHASAASPLVIRVEVPGLQVVEHMKLVSCRADRTPIPQERRFVNLTKVKWTIADTLSCCQQFGEVESINHLEPSYAARRPQSRATKIAFFDVRSTSVRVFAAVVEAHRLQAEAALSGVSSGFTAGALDNVPYKNSKQPSSQSLQQQPLTGLNLSCGLEAPSQQYMTEGLGNSNRDADEATRRQMDTSFLSLGQDCQAWRGSGNNVMTDDCRRTLVKLLSSISDSNASASDQPHHRGLAQGVLGLQQSQQKLLQDSLNYTEGTGVQSYTPSSSRDTLLIDQWVPKAGIMGDGSYVDPDEGLYYNNSFEDSHLERFMVESIGYDHSQGIDCGDVFYRTALGAGGTTRS